MIRRYCARLMISTLGSGPVLDYPPGVGEYPECDGSVT